MTIVSCAQAREETKHKEADKHHEHHEKHHRRHKKHETYHHRMTAREKALYIRNWRIILEALRHCNLQENSLPVRLALGHIRAAEETTEHEKRHVRKPKRLPKHKLMLL